VNGGLVGEAGSPRRTAAKWNDLGRRTLSAALLAPVALLCIWFGGPAYAALLALAAAGLSLEWVWLCGASSARWPGLAVPILVVAAALIAPGYARVAVGLLLIGFGLVWGLCREPMLAVGTAYIGFPAVALVWLRLGTGEAGRGNLLFLVLVVWASDIGAYVTGRLLGGPKLAPALSPGKTWSGAIGGLICAMAAGLAAAALLGTGPSLTAALIGGILGIATQAGDLLESGIKRHFGVKDSGRLIPGHGGLLDRLDGLLAAASVAALAVLIGREGVLWQ
jgi:phosphatidate cytidylyltransferase